MMPTFQGCMLPILKICENDQKYRTHEIVKKLADWFTLTEEEKSRGTAKRPADCSVQ